MNNSPLLATYTYTCIVSDSASLSVLNAVTGNLHIYMYCFKEIGRASCRERV